MVAWNYLGQGMMLDLMHMLGFGDELNSARADRSGRSYIESVRTKDGRKRPYATAEGSPLRSVS
jgi:hypothetical protein